MLPTGPPAPGEGPHCHRSGPISKPPGHLQPRVGDRPTVADDMDEACLGEDPVKEAIRGHPVNLWMNVSTPARKPGEEELAKPSIQPGVTSEATRSREEVLSTGESWRSRARYASDGA